MNMKSLRSLIVLCFVLMLSCAMGCHETATPNVITGISQVKSSSLLEFHQDSGKPYKLATYIQDKVYYAALADENNKTILEHLVMPDSAGNQRSIVFRDSAGAGLSSKIYVPSYLEALTGHTDPSKAWLKSCVASIELANDPKSTVLNAAKGLGEIKIEHPGDITTAALPEWKCHCGERFACIGSAEAACINSACDYINCMRRNWPYVEVCGNERAEAELRCTASSVEE